MYMPEVGRWGAADPMSEKREWLSPYNYVQNNPVIRVDPDGAFDDFVFNQMGKFVRIDRNDRPDKLIVENSQTGVKQKYDFADPVADPQAIRNGAINQLAFVPQSEIQGMLEQQGAFDRSNQHGWVNFFQESIGSGKFDYSYSVIPRKFSGASFDPLTKPSPVLFLPEGESMAHNHMNFGNYLWAASGYTLGFSYATLQFAAHGNSIIDPGRANGYKAQLDSRDDQISIIKGAYHAQRNQYRKILEQRKK